ncbi:DUF4097 domain-containing protein [Gemmatimonadota bacterium]
MMNGKVSGRLLAAGLFFLGAACQQASSQETIEREFEINGQQSMEIDLNAGGAITVRGWDEPRATVRVRFGRTDPDAFRFDFDQSRSKLTVRSERLSRVQNVDIRIDVRVPRGFDLDLRTGGGGITISGIEGVIDGGTGGGELDLWDLKGTIRLTTGGGEITVRDSKLDGRVSTGGGAVLVENVVGDFRATSGGGEVIYRNVVTPDRTWSADVVHIRNAGGNIEVEDAPAGADLSTGGGEIDVRSAGSFVKARTGGGDIRIGTVDGWVETSTGGGDITIVGAMGRIEATTGAGMIQAAMTGDPDEGSHDVNLRSGYGDITLTIPEDLDATIEIELGYTRDARRVYRIDSDFDLREERTEEWDRSQGTPRRFIFGKAEFGDGRHTIRIRTTNGNVYLRKGD